MSPNLIFFLSLFTILLFFIRSIIDCGILVAVPTTFYYVKDMSIDVGVPLFLLVCLICQTVIIILGMYRDREDNRAGT